MILQDVWKTQLTFSTHKPIVIEPVAEHLTSDAGMLLFGELDQQLDFTREFAAQLDDPRQDPNHPFLQMSRSRIFGIIAGYEDQNDHDALGKDPVFKLLADRLPDDDDLASQPTLSRFENAITPRSLLRLEEWFINRFVESFDQPPAEITLDIDVFDDPTHGQQQLTFYHGFYKQYQYLVRAITCAENDYVVLPVLLHGTAHAALGAHLDVARVVKALRAKFPDVRIHLRADSGYAVPVLYETCEDLRIDYSIGMYPAIKQQSAALLQQAVDQYADTSRPQRLFTGFSYQAGSWPMPRWVVVKCEANSPGTNRRAVVNNQPAGCVGRAARCLRRVRRAWRKREPQQGVEVRTMRGPFERPSLHGELFSDVLTLCGGELVDSHASAYRQSTAGAVHARRHPDAAEQPGSVGSSRPAVVRSVDRCGPTQRVCGRTRSPGGSGEWSCSPTTIQPSSSSRSVGRGSRLHVAADVNQSRGEGGSHGASRARVAFW